jgi:probable F420-dependent oxidoreductase
MSMMWTQRLGRVGVWRGASGVDPALARTMENLGYGTVWLGGSPGSDLVGAEELLDATASLVVATGVVNIWNSDAAELAASYRRITDRHPGRLLLGIGSGHREATPQRARPIEAMSAYLDVLDAGGVPVHDRVLSALGPRMLALASERSAGTHPYLTVPSQTRDARRVLGPDALVAPEQTVVLDVDPATARREARAFLRRYLGMVNYTSTMLRGGFTEHDIAGEGSDALIDGIVVHGDAATLASAVRAHLDAGADHVCIQVQPFAGDTVSVLEQIAAEFGDRAEGRRAL